MAARYVNVAREFSPRPRGRDDRDLVGPWHGVAFRTAKLIGPLRAGELVTVDFDGTEAIGPSFLEEAFGGLIRDEKFTLDQLKKLLSIRSSMDPSRGKRAWEYMEEAAQEGAA